MSTKLTRSLGLYLYVRVYLVHFLMLTSLFEALLSDVRMCVLVSIVSQYTLKNIKLTVNNHHDDQVSFS